MSDVVSTLAPRQRAFINTRVLKRQMPQLPSVQQGRYITASAKAQRVFDAADGILKVRPLQPGVAQVAGAYTNAADKLAADLRIPDYVAALASLQTKLAAAEAILAARARAAADLLKQKQFDDQSALYQDLAPTLTDVKKSYLPDGAAKRIGKEKLAPEAEFKTYLAALQTLEAAKKGVDPAQPVARNVAQDIKTKCDLLIAAAQAYLDHYEADLTDKQKNDKASLTKKRYCEESLIAARHYGMAMELDAMGPPQQDQPWDRETEIRVAGLRAAMNFETGYQKAKGLGDDGTGGASDSYWIRSASPQDGTDETGKPTVTMVANKRGEAIFKPFVGEEAPDGSTDRKGAGAAKESLASANAKLFGAMTGIDLGVPDTSVVSIGGYAVNGADPKGPPLIGSAQQHAGVKDQIKDLPRDVLRKVKPEEAHKMALMDIMSLSIDRHSGNIMVDNADPENPKLIPIDHGGTLPSRGDFTAVKSRMGGIIYSPTSGAVTIVNTVLGMPAAYENFDPEMVAKIDLLDPEAMEQGMKAQRDALDKVHPGLGAGDKVGDDSLQMSKRSMMFLKKAARILSPAEIQITLAARGEELFDVADGGFDTLADQIIAEAAEQKPAYKEFMSYPNDQQSKVLTWLYDNGWTMTDANGNKTPTGFLMRDPTTALKLYKSQTANDAVLPEPPPSVPVWKAPTDGALPDDTTKQAICAAFPQIKIDSGNDSQWKGRLAAWGVIQAKGGMNTYQAVLQATGAQDDGTIGSAVDALIVWEEINKPQYATVLAQLKPESGSRKPGNILRRAMAADANRQLGAQLLDQASNAGAGVDEVAARRASAGRLLTDAAPVIAGLVDRNQAGVFQGQVDDANAKLQRGEATAAEADARALLIAVTEFALAECTREATGIADQLAGLQMTDVQAKRAADAKAVIMEAASLSAARDMLTILRALDQEVRTGGAQPKPQVVPQQPLAPQGQGPLGNAPQQAPVGRVALPAFTWNPADATAAKKQAVKAKVIKDKDTGMTKALASVTKARAAVDGMKNTATVASKRATLTRALDAYLDFSRFVASKLRILSRDAGWMAYCDSASDLAEQDAGAIRTRLESLPDGLGVRG